MLDGGCEWRLFELMPCVVVLGMSDSPFLESEVLELRYESELWLERLT